MRHNKGSYVALVALISLVVGASYHRPGASRNNRQPPRSRTRAKARPAPRTFGHPTAGDQPPRRPRARLIVVRDAASKNWSLGDRVLSVTPIRILRVVKATTRTSFMWWGFLCDFNRVTDKVQVSTRQWCVEDRRVPPGDRGKTHHRRAVSRDDAWLYRERPIRPGCTLGTAGLGGRFDGTTNKKSRLGPTA